jgi:hypothetical protein
MSLRPGLLWLRVSQVEDNSCIARDYWVSELRPLSHSPKNIMFRKFGLFHSSDGGGETPTPKGEPVSYLF